MKRIVIFLISFFLYGCVTQEMELPEVTLADVKIIHKLPSEQSTFVLQKIISTIKRGTPIITYPNDWKTKDYGGWTCSNSYITAGTEEWGAGSLVLGNWSTELGEIFYEALTSRGYKIAGDPNQLFEKEDEVMSAEYSVGGALIDMKGNFCQVHDFWTGYPMGKFAGEMYLKVKWTIYNNLAKEEVFSMTTEGKSLQKEAKKQGIVFALNDAFSQAAEQLTSNQEFYNLAAREYKKEKGEIVTGDKITINGITKRHDNISKKIEMLLPAVVTVRVGQGHGSGFFISKDGHLLTNYHVVSKTDTVQVVLNNGLEIKAKVLKKNKVRDVALVKADLKIPKALAIDKNEPAIAENVMAIGSPLDESLKSTVTKGIVSTIKIFEEINAQKYIQADVAISPGNSGGPLINEKGNVIGIAVAGYTSGQNLNLFIPIKEALEALNISIKTQ